MLNPLNNINGQECKHCFIKQVQCQDCGCCAYHTYKMTPRCYKGKKSRQMNKNNESVI